MSTASQAVITAALGLVVGYESAMAQSLQTYPEAPPYEQQQSMHELAEAIHAVSGLARELERTFMALSKKCIDNGVGSHVPPDGVARLQELATSLRGVEVALKNCKVPEQLTEQHEQLRRSVAKGRSWVVVVQDLARQAYSMPVLVDGETEGEALRTLAGHTTQRLVTLANA